MVIIINNRGEKKHRARIGKTGRLKRKRVHVGLLATVLVRMVLRSGLMVMPVLRALRSLICPGRTSEWSARTLGLSQSMMDAWIIQEWLTRSEARRTATSRVFVVGGGGVRARYL